MQRIDPMRDFRDAKAMAQTLRDALKAKSVTLTNSESLELIAKILGFHDWNVLSARIQTEPKPRPIRIPANVPALPLPGGADLPLLALRDIVLFPRMFAPIFVEREKTKRALDCAMAADRHIFVVTQRQARDDDPTQEALYGVGVVAHVIDFMPPDARIMVRGLKRVTLTRLVRGEMLAANVAPFADSGGDTALGEMLARTILDRLQGYLNVNFASEPYSRLPHIREPSVLADVIAPLMPIEIGQRQELLETGNGTARLEKILALIKNGRRAA
jgi:ATP-dependent Lon protease